MFARRLFDRGLALKLYFQVNTYFTGDQAHPAWRPTATAVSRSPGTAKTRTTDFTAPSGTASSLAPLDVDGNGATDPLTDGLLALRYLFGFRGATLIDGAVGGGCTRCDATAIELTRLPAVAED